jgi:hypothetical protein
MKLLAGFLILLCTNALAIPGIPISNGPITNPGTNAVMATMVLPASGSIASPPSANYFITGYWTCTVAALYEYQTLNASAVVQTAILLPCVANASNPQLTTNPISFSVQDGYTIRVINLNSYTGTGQVTLFYGIETLN